MPRATLFATLVAASALAFPPVPDGYAFRGADIPKGTVLLLTETRQSRHSDGDPWSSSRKDRIELKAVAGRRATVQRIEFLENATKTAGGKEEPVHSALTGRAGTMKFVKGNWSLTMDRLGAGEIMGWRPWSADDHFFPHRRVKVGDRWKVSADELKAVYKERFQFRLERSEAKAKFEAVEPYGGEPCAVVRIELTFRGAWIGADDRVEQKNQYVVRRSLRTGLDRKVTIDAEVRDIDADGNLGPPTRERIERTLTVEKKP